MEMHKDVAKSIGFFLSNHSQPGLIRERQHSSVITITDLLQCNSFGVSENPSLMREAISLVTEFFFSKEKLKFLRISESPKDNS